MRRRRPGAGHGDNAFALVAPVAAVVGPPLGTLAALPRAASNAIPHSLAAERAWAPQFLAAVGGNALALVPPPRGGTLP